MTKMILKKAILENYNKLRKCLENSKKSIFDVLFLAKNKDEKPIYAIVEVSPDIKNVVSKNIRLYINMRSQQRHTYHDEKLFSLSLFLY